MSAPRLRRCETKQEMERVVDDLAVQGYKIKNRSETSALIEKPEFGGAGVHIVIFCLTFWSFGLANAIYAGVKYAGRDQIALKVEDKENN
jgi:hypothetical protein